MKNQLIEIAFSGASIEKIGFLLKDLTSNGKKIENYVCSSDVKNIDWDDPASIEEIFRRNESFCLLISLSELIEGDVCLPKCGVSIYKSKNSVDIELDFQLSDLRNPKLDKLAEDLIKLSKSIADRYGLAGYFCGIEPAKDEETRFFTNDQLGPLHFE
jgi:hypothetical protein